MRETCCRLFIWIAIAFVVCSPSALAQGVASQADVHASVNFAEIAAQPAPQDTQRRSVPRMRPVTENEVPAAAAAIAKEQRVFAATVTGPGAFTSGALSPSAASSFAGGTDDDTAIPPDTHGAAGPNHLMVALNDGVFIQNRSTGALIGSKVRLDTFWASTGAAGVFDPRVMYDPYNSRWIFTAVSNAESASSSILIGASRTSDPTGTWNLYRVTADSGGTLWADYPNLGFNSQWIVVTVNMFGNVNGAFSKARILAFNKANLYANLTGAFTAFEDVSGSSQVPALTFDNSLTTMYLVRNWNGNSSGNGFLRISTITGAVGSETYTSGTAFPSTSNTWSSSQPGGAESAPQSGASQKIDAGDARLLSLIYRNGSLWASHTAFLPATSPSRSAAQWWQISPSGTVQQFGRVDDSTGATFYAYPSLAVNKNNDVLMGYTQFSATTFASAAYSFRSAADPSNTMQSPVTLKAGEASYYKTFGGTENRWGDYSNTSVDPVNDVDMWTIQEYAASPNFSNTDNRWGTWWGKVSPPASALPIITGISATQGAQGQTVSMTITGTSLAGATAVTFSGAGVTAAISSGGTATSLPAIVTITSGAATGLRTVTVTTTSGTSDPFSGFTIVPPPVITSITPTSGNVGTSVSAVIAGTNLSGATVVTFSGTGVTGSITSGGTATSVPVTIAIASDAALVVRSFTVTTSLGTSASFSGFTVTRVPTITSMSPNTGSAGSSLNATISGTNLDTATDVTFSGSGVTASIRSGGTATSLPILVSLAANASLGARTVTVTSPTGVSQAFSGFTVTASTGGPTLNDLTANPPGLSQNLAALGGSPFVLTVNGTNFTSTSKIVAGATQVTTSLTDPTRVTASMPAAVLSAPGPLGISVIDAGATSNSLTLTVVERGDVSANRSITIGDALVTALTVGGLVKPSLTTAVGDVNVSGAANIGDALTLALFAGRSIANLPTPTITSVSPATAVAGSALTIIGSGFAANAADNQVVFPIGANTFVRVVPDSATTASLTLTVPAAAVSGPLQVIRLDSAIGSDEFPLLVAGTPTPLLVTSVQPFYRVATTSSITLAGLGFDPLPANNNVLFRSASGTVGATVTAASTTSLTVTIPNTALCGGVSVGVGSLTSNLRTVIVSGTTCPVLLTDIVAGAAPGDVLVLEGAGFDVPAPANNTVTFTATGGATVPSTVIMSGASQLHVRVPASAVDGNVTVSVGGQTSNALFYKKQ